MGVLLIKNTRYYKNIDVFKSKSAQSNINS